MNEIMIVDDTPANLKLLESILVGEGYNIRVAISGEMAIKSAAKFLPDLILMDINMPGISGIEACTKIKSDPELSEIPIIFISANSDTNSIEEAFAAGGHDYITKPFRSREVLVRVKSVLSMIQAQKEKYRAQLLSSMINIIMGVAHEMNTPIGVCVTASSHLLDHAEKMNVKLESNTIKRDDISDWIDQDKDISQLVTTNLSKLNQLVTAFKTLPVHDISDTEEVDLCELMNSVVESNEKLLEKNDVTVNLSCDDITVPTKKKLIFKLFDKLIENSIDHAFEGIKSRAIDIEFKILSKEMNIIYQDNGVGMDFNSLEKIFDPFFTTKRIDKHLGFSATIIYMTVIWALEGSIQVKSDKGLKYIIRIPFN
ncbi:putative Signal transduction histidine kinase [Vibrio nigripulchritudo SO65]|uniref:hybrid sensor histidine kinase/response regulator n=1 Tax=Vibrio nigripulchritudo TaxID=28173 RepID=UPI0003B1D815|nr:hybrid sensor histidine kinase/response regulator [Vibrio nigripulchritudo]CCN37794.1 putative Signal transduction histidine kinase [Vibrio nigripulchritudo AM115]CCN44782.1 putative Signal transduction histidine kinase [Vibrio nigripulchritudo FTn2]CCN62898.1 putative Signal transduction histidine kinase [Vibrio nigripulchritudo POn4]CCN77886.1 putative Signal transduction histidine kinase [Vibrio nigripulchritudo SO65]